MSKKDYQDEAGMTRAERLWEDGFYFMDPRDFHSDEEPEDGICFFCGAPNETWTCGYCGMSGDEVCDVFMLMYAMRQERKDEHD